MAEALIKASDAVHPDPVKDRRGSHKRGDIILVRPDGWAWGSGELNPAVFTIISVPDSWLDGATEYGQELTESYAQIIPTSAQKRRRVSRMIGREKERKPIKRHRWSVDLDNGNQLIDHRSE